MMYLIEGGCGVLWCQLETSRDPPAETWDWLPVYWGWREMEEDADPSDVWVAGLTSKETYIPSLSWVLEKWIDLDTRALES